MLPYTWDNMREGKEEAEKKPGHMDKKMENRHKAFEHGDENIFFCMRERE